MMGVYIKDMEMPTEGTVFVIDSTGQVWSNEWPTRGYTRLDGVKAVPIPPHGDLIDRDVAYDKIAEQEGGNYVDMDAVGMGLSETPVVIPAEEKV